MIVGLLDNFLGFLLILALILYLGYYPWFKKYLLVVTIPCVYVVQVLARLIIGLIMLTPKLVVGSAKAVLIAGFVLILSLIYLVTSVIPHVGERAEGWKESAKDGLVASYFALQVRRMREVMVQIVAEEGDRKLKYEEPDKYREELARVEQDAKNKLETGETLLSILLGAVLLFAKLTGTKLLDASVFSIPVDLLIEGWLLFIAVSIIYRSSALELLTYRSDEEFESLAEMDAALSYQKGMSLVGFIHGLMFLVVFMAAVTRVRYNLVEEGLRAVYTDEPWVASIWDKLHN